MRRLSLPAALLAIGMITPAAAETLPAPCPSQPVRVVRSLGGSNDYLGTVPGMPDLCRMTRIDGTGDYYFGTWRTDWPGAGQAYPAMRQVLAGGPGARASFVTRSYPGYQFKDTYINEGWDSVVVAGVEHATLKMAHEREGIEGNTYHSVITSWRDRATGAVLKTEERQISGQSYGPETTWHALRIEAAP